MACRSLALLLRTAAIITAGVFVSFLLPIEKSFLLHADLNPTADLQLA